MRSRVVVVALAMAVGACKDPNVARRVQVYSDVAAATEEMQKCYDAAVYEYIDGDAVPAIEERFRACMDTVNRMYEVKP